MLTSLSETSRTVRREKIDTKEVVSALQPLLPSGFRVEKAGTGIVCFWEDPERKALGVEVKITDKILRELSEHNIITLAHLLIKLRNRKDLERAIDMGEEVKEMPWLLAENN